MDAEQLYQMVLQVGDPWFVEEVRGTPSQRRPGKVDKVVVVLLIARNTPAQNAEGRALGTIPESVAGAT